MYTMKQVCEKTGMTYETLKFYCNVGLIPNVERDKNNRRIFSDTNLQWIKGLRCLKNCNMSIVEMKKYLELCIAGNETIPVRKAMLAEKQDELRKKIADIEEAIAYIDWKQNLYDSMVNSK